MKVVFMGNPNFALQVLSTLYASKHEVVAVVCTTDKPTGRGKALAMPATKKFALEKGLPVFQFEKIKDEGVEVLKNLKADVFVTAAFGQILSKEILDIAPYGTINVHGSLLPKYRGASPVQYAILKGEKTTGVTIMQTDIGVDDGDIFLKKELEIDSEDTTETLMNKLSILGGDALVEVLDRLEKNSIQATKQNHELATKTFMLKKEKSFINFNLSAEKIVNFVRAYFPNPVARIQYQNQEIKVLKAKVFEFDSQETFENGQVVFASAKQGLVIACENGFVEIETLQAQSSKAMKAKDYLNGKKIEIGTII